MRRGPPEAPAVDGAGEDHVALVGGEVEVRVVRVLQARAPVVHVLARVGRGAALGLAPPLCSFLQDLGSEECPRERVDLGDRGHGGLSLGCSVRPRQETCDEHLPSLEPRVGRPGRGLG